VDAAGKAWQVHHIKPVSFGGGNLIENLIPLPGAEHSIFTTWWNSVWRRIRARFTDAEWEAIYTTGKKVVQGSKLRQAPIP
jgi:5-methylcytosine-specific restriction endonuclease McrA